MNTALQKETPLWKTGGLSQTGVIVEIDAAGRPAVDYVGNELGPIAARTAIPSARRGDAVLLIFDGGDPTLPIIIGVVRDHFEESQPRQFTIAAREILVDGAEEVSLRCGDSSLTLRKDGKIVLKGNDVLSRASRTNRVKGAAVKIN